MFTCLTARKNVMGVKAEAWLKEAKVKRSELDFLCRMMKVLLVSQTWNAF
jgi:hypothetical protein